MTQHLQCPLCSAALSADAGDVWFCARDAYTLRAIGAQAPAELQDTGTEPTPAETGPLLACLGELRAGDPFKAAFEHLLLALAESAADETMLYVKESRGAWVALLDGAGGKALFLGNPFSGTTVALAQAGFRLTLLDTDERRLSFGLQKLAALGRTPAEAYASAPETALPFGDQSFDLVVQEEGLPSAGPARAQRIAELARVSRAEVVVCAENRLAYKRSTGRRGRFDVPGPLSYLRRAFFPAQGELTLRGWQQILKAALPSWRAFALYPHSREFSHVVALREPRPRLTIGPKERRNWPQMAATKLGLFPWLTPSYLFLGRRGAPSPPRGTRLARVLRELGQRLDEPPGELDQVVATRSDTCLVHTCPTPASIGKQSGGWTLHLPLSPQKRHLLAKHHSFLQHVRERFPEVPVPEPLFAGELEGLYLTCERRLPGLTAPHYSGVPRIIARMLSNAAQDFSKLCLGAATQMTEQLYQELVWPRFEIVARHAGQIASERALWEMEARVRELLIGQNLPLVLYHADLRSKHVQIDSGGRVLGYLDWGASEARFLPYVDLVHLIAHERKQELGLTPGESWAILRERHTLRPYESLALEGYCQKLGLSDEVRRAVELCYPVLVTAMAELNWAFSRPRWLKRQFGL